MLTLRPATVEDAYFVYQCRFAPSALQVSLSTELVPYADHLAWFQRHSQEYQIGMVADQPVGYGRLSRQPPEISVAIAPWFHRMSFGSQILAAMTDIGLQHSTAIIAKIKRGNLASQRTFASCGYVHTHNVDSSGQLIELWVRQR